MGAHPALPAGTRVELHGLQSATHLNGRTAHVLGLNTDSGRLTVELILALPGEAHLQKVKEGNLLAVVPMPRTAAAVQEVLAGADAGCRVSIPAGTYVASGERVLEIPTALTLEGNKAELHFAVAVSPGAKGTLLRLANFSVVGATVTVRGMDIRHVVLEQLDISLLDNYNENDALTLNGIRERGSRSILVDRCTVRGGADSVMINEANVHLRGCRIEQAESRGIFANDHFVIQDSIVANCGNYGMKTRGGCVRLGSNSIQPGPWDMHEQRYYGSDDGDFTNQY